VTLTQPVEPRQAIAISILSSESDNLRDMVGFPRFKTDMQGGNVQLT
jgi:hypothetical protein